MKKFAVVLPLALFSSCAFAGASLDALASQKGCTICHKIDGLSVGPSFKDISSRYNQTKKFDILLADGSKAESADEVLAERILNGSKGNWSDQKAMPSQRGKLNDAEIRQIISGILDLSK